MGIKNIRGELRVNNNEVVTTANIIEFAEKATPELLYGGTGQCSCKGGPVAGDVRIASQIDRGVVSRIEQAAFENNTEITSVIIPNSVTDIGPRVFNNCSNLIDVVLSDKLTQLLRRFFSNCRTLITVNIPKSITTIGVSAFDGCESLTYIIIPISVTSISYDAFRGCPNLTIYCEANEQPEGWDENWNPDNRPVVWGFKNNFIDLNNAISTEANSDLIVKRDTDGEIELVQQDLEYIKNQVDIAVSGRAVHEYTEARLKDKVDKVDGKGLSTNDFTDEYKTAISNIELLALQSLLPINELTEPVNEIKYTRDATNWREYIGNDNRLRILDCFDFYVSSYSYDDMGGVNVEVTLVNKTSLNLILDIGIWGYASNPSENILITTAEVVYLAPNSTQTIATGVGYFDQDYPQFIFDDSNIGVNSFLFLP